MADSSEQEPEASPFCSPAIIRQLAEGSKPLRKTDLRLMDWRWAFTVLTPVSAWSVFRCYDRHDLEGILITSLETLACFFCGSRGWLLRRRCRWERVDLSRAVREQAGREEIDGS